MERKRASIILFGFLKAIILVIVIAGLVFVGRNAYDFGYKVFAEETVSQAPGRQVAFTLEEGISGAELGQRLEERGLIKDGNVFRVQYLLSEYKDQLKPGNYILNTAQTSEEMLTILADDVEEETETP